MLSGVSVEGNEEVVLGSSPAEVTCVGMQVLCQYGTYSKYYSLPLLYSWVLFAWIALVMRSAVLLFWVLSTPSAAHLVSLPSKLVRFLIEY